MKGALSVAASAYKALFTGQSTPAQVFVFSSSVHDTPEQNINSHHIVTFLSVTLPFKRFGS